MISFPFFFLPFSGIGRGPQTDETGSKPCSGATAFHAGPAGAREKRKAIINYSLSVLCKHSFSACADTGNLKKLK